MKNKAVGFAENEFHCREHDATLNDMPAGGHTFFIGHCHVQVQSVRSGGAGQR